VMRMLGNRWWRDWAGTSTLGGFREINEEKDRIRGWE